MSFIRRGEWIKKVGGGSVDNAKKRGGVRGERPHKVTWEKGKERGYERSL